MVAYRRYVVLSIVTLLSLPAMPTHAEVAVIIHPSNTAAVSDTDIKNFYLGRQKTFSSGDTAVLLSLSEGEASRSEFNNKVLSKTDAQLKAFWSKVLFTGKGTPPKDVSQAELLKLVASNPNMIGFVDAAAVTADVKVVAKY